MAVEHHNPPSVRQKPFWQFVDQIIREHGTPDTTRLRAFADWLQDHDDPRHVIARNAQPVVVNHTRESIIPSRMIRPAGEDAPWFIPDYPVGGEPATMHYKHGAVRLGVIDDPRRYIRWEPGKVYTRPLLIWNQRFPGRGEMTLHAPVTVRELYEFIDKLPDGDVKRRWTSVAAANKLLLARMKAPAGGMIVNNQFQVGGQFLAKPMKKIRDAVAAWRARNGGAQKLSRERTAADPLPGHLEPAMHAAGFDPNVDTKLTHEQIARIADVHGLPHPELRTREDREKFFDQLVASRQPVANIKAQLLDKRTDPDLVLAYMVPHLIADSNSYGKNTSWYSGDVDKMERGARHILGKDFPPGSPNQTLLKVLIAATSAGQEPDINVPNAIRMTEEGQLVDPRNPWRHIPPLQEARLRAWLAKQNPIARHVGLTPQEHLNWWLAHDENKLTTADYRAYPAIVSVKRDANGKILKNHPEHDQLVAFEAPKSYELKPGERRGGKGGKLVILPNMGKWLDPSRKRDRRNAAFPVPDGNGEIQAKAWTARDSDVLAGKLEDIRHIIDHFGGNMPKVQQWLISDHPRGEFESVVGHPVEDVDEVLAPHEHVPGTFFLGPKFGAFALNLHQNTHPSLGRFLTADVWWTRTWNRFMGTLHDVATGKSQALPRTPRERKLMWAAAKIAAKECGFKSVADLQANLWYHEQHLDRMFGGDAASTSVVDGINRALMQRGHKLRLSRTNEFATATPFFEYPNDENDAPILADKLADHNDPREEIVRTHLANHAAAAAKNQHYNWATDIQKRVGDRSVLFRPAFVSHHTFPDGTVAWMSRYGRGDSTHWHVSWEGPETDNDDAPRYDKVFPHDEFRNWLKKWPIDQLKRYLGSYRAHWNNMRFPITRRPRKLARSASSPTRSFWVSPQGEMHEVGMYGHDQFAKQQGEAGVPELRAKGWARVVGAGDMLMTDDTPNPRQSRTLTDHAIENGYNHVWHTGTDRPLWSRPQDERPEQLARGKSAKPGATLTDKLQTRAEKLKAAGKLLPLGRVMTAMLHAAQTVWGWKRVKLARTPKETIQQFANGHLMQAHQAAERGEDIAASMQDGTAHRVFADLLEEHDDPHHEIVRKSFHRHFNRPLTYHEGRAAAIDKADGLEPGTTPEYAPDAQRIERFAHYRGDGGDTTVRAIRGKKGLAFHVMWYPPNGGLLGTYNAAFTGPEFANLLRRLEPDERDALVKDLKRYQGPPRPRRLARPAEPYQIAFVSPSQRENSTFDQAAAGLKSPEMRSLEQDTPGGASGVGLWKDGAEESRLVKPQPGASLDQTAAALGKKYHQKGVVTFRAGTGQDLAHVVVLPGKLDPVTVHDVFMKHGVEYKTIHGNVVHILDPGGSLAPNVQAATKELKARQRSIPGTFRYIGSDDRQSAQRAYDKVLGEQQVPPRTQTDPVALARSKRPQPFWQDPAGELHPLGTPDQPYETHQEWADRHNESEETLKAKGWNRIVSDGSTLYVDRDTLRAGDLPHRQRAPLINHAIESGHQSLVMDGLRPRPIWEQGL